MDEATKQALNEFVQQVITAAKIGTQWTVEQTPILVQEWLAWIFWSSIAQTVASLLIVAGTLAIYIYGWRKGYKLAQAQDRYWDWDIFTEFWSLGGGLVTIIVICIQISIAWHYAMLAIQVVMAPRVLVLEKFAELVK